MKKKKVALVMCMMAVAQLAGCGSSQASIEDYGVEESVKSDNETTDNDATSDESVSSSENEYGLEGKGIPEHVKCSLQKDEHSKSLEIDADVVSTGAEIAKIYKAEQNVLSEEQLISFADSIFDNGKYERILPYRYWEKEDKENDRIKYEKMAEEAGPEYAESEALFTKFVYDSTSSIHDVIEKPEEPEEGKILYRSVEENYGYEADEYFTVLRGTIEGKEYELDYEKDAGGYYQSLRIIPLFPITNSVNTMAITPESMGNEQTCDKEKLVNKANELVGLLTQDYFMCSDEDRACVNVDTNNIFYDGVYLNYTLKFPELSPSLCEVMSVGIEEDVPIGEESDPLAPRYLSISQPLIQVEMDQEGSLIKFVYSDNIKLGETVAEHVKLMEFSDIMKSLDGYLGELDDTYELGWDSRYISDIRLCYLPIYENQMLYMPYWVFLTKDTGVVGTGSPYFGTIAVNAVDGSCVVMNYFQKI